MEFKVPWADPSVTIARGYIKFDLSIFLCSGGKKNYTVDFITTGSKYRKPGNLATVSFAE